MMLSGEIKTPSRRALVAGAAWAAPLVVVSSTIPAYAASTCTLDNATPMLLDVNLSSLRGDNLLTLRASATLAPGGDGSSDPSDGGGEDPAPDTVDLPLDDPRLALFTLPAGQAVMNLQLTLIYRSTPDPAPAQAVSYPDVDTSTFSVVAATTGPTPYGASTSYTFTYTVTLLRDVVGLSDYVDLWNSSFATAQLVRNGAGEVDGNGYISASPADDTELYNADGACEAVTLDAFGAAVSLQISGGGS